MPRRVLDCEQLELSGLWGHKGNELLRWEIFVSRLRQPPAADEVGRLKRAGLQLHYKDTLLPRVDRSRETTRRAFTIPRLIAPTNMTMLGGWRSRIRERRHERTNVLGYNYNYDYYNEHTGRVTYAQNIYDSTLDRSYEYDHVGRLADSHSGAEARAATGQGPWNIMDGPYSQGYDYDVWGNVTHKFGWGGEVQGGTAGQTSDIYYTYTNNRRNGFSYDAAGNLTNDLGQTFTYDVTGQQTNASYGGYSLVQSYDGDGRRVKKNENGTITYYLRSSVLGGQVVAEINGSGGLQRSYVYLGGQLLALKQSGSYYWVHEDPVTKSKRVVDQWQTLVSTIELDPWGADTPRSNNAAFQPKKFTSYDRDGNASDEAMFRRYNRWHSRFDQPDPYDGSYSLTDPQSFNRYAYVQNDPVNFVDPTGLDDYFIPAWENGWDRFANPIETFLNGAMRDFVRDYNWFVREEEGGVEFDGFAPFSFGWGSRGRGRLGGVTPQKPSDDKEVQRRIAEGQAWDRWYAWVNCNTPIMNKYNAQINDFLKIGGEAFWWEVGAGLGAATTILGAGFGSEAGIMDGGPPVGGWGVALIIVGVHSAERKHINGIKSEYQKEVTEKCGPKPPHP